MRGLKTLIAAVAAIALVAFAVTASAGAAAFQHYVSCSSSALSQKSQPTHSCASSDSKGAFFQSNDSNVAYTVCVSFPNGKSLCAKKQKAKKGILYVNKITSNIPGRHKATWFVEGKPVGSFAFHISVGGQ